jgi:5-methylcytosine-specific restriction protein A
MIRREQPICADPFGDHAKNNEVVPVTQTDHIVPVSAGGDDDRANLQALCASCHSRKTATEDGGFGHARKTKGREP